MQTKRQVERFKQLSEFLDESTKGKKCAGMEDLVKEGSAVSDEGSETAAS